MEGPTPDPSSSGSPKKACNAVLTTRELIWASLDARRRLAVVGWLHALCYFEEPWTEVF